MNNNTTEFESITDREIAPSITDPRKNKKPLPKGVTIGADRAVITEKRVALDMFDSGFPIFVIGEDGVPHYLESRADVENHSGMYNVPADDMYLFLERDAGKEHEKTEAEKVNEQEERTLSDISAFTGISLMRLYSLPSDVKHDVISLYMTNVNISANEDIKSQIQNILDGKPAEEQPKEKYNPLAKVEELVEGNYNNIDGVINNLPSGTSVMGKEEERPSVLQAIRELQGNSSSSEPERGLDIPYPAEDNRQR